MSELKFIPASQRVPRMKTDERAEICISCGFFIYETQEIEMINLGQKAKGNLKISSRHANYLDCRVSINIGEPSPDLYGPMRYKYKARPTSLQEQED